MSTMSTQAIIPTEGGYYTDGSRQNFVATTPPFNPNGGGTNPFLNALLGYLSSQAGQPGYNLPSPGPAYRNEPMPAPLPTTGGITNAPPAQNPFGGLMNSLPTTGWANPNAQAWTQAALGAPYMQGWGNAAPAGSPGATGPAAPGQQAPAAGPKLFTDVQVSDEARKMAKQFKKARDASGWDLKDIGMVIGNVALGVATGGASLPGQIAGGALGGIGAGIGADKGNKSAGKSVKQIRKIRDTAMGQLGYTMQKKKDGGTRWLDSAGNALSPPQMFQLLMENGYLGG